MNLQANKLILLCFISAGLTGCSLFRKVNVRAQVGAEYPVESRFQTEFVKADLKPDTGLSRGFGVGHPLSKNINLSFETTLTETKSKELDARMSWRSIELFADYYFAPNSRSTPTVGAGLGTLATSFFGDSPKDRGHAYTLRGGWIWKWTQSISVFTNLHITRADEASVRRFYFFGSKGEVEHTLIGFHVGLAANLFPKERPATPAAPVTTVENPSSVPSSNPDESKDNPETTEAP